MYQILHKFTLYFCILYILIILVFNAGEHRSRLIRRRLSKGSHKFEILRGYNLIIAPEKSKKNEGEKRGKKLKGKRKGKKGKKKEKEERIKTLVIIYPPA